MEKKNLFDRWLDHDLSEEERSLLESDERFRAFETITQAAQYFRSPEIDTSSSFDRLLSTLEQKKQKESKAKNLYYYISSVAALLLIALLTYNTLSNPAQEFNTATGEQLAVELPSKSQVYLNASASLTYTDKNWDNKREVTLIGEAFFDVSSGAPFTVNTADASIVVTGTQFNIAQHKNYLQVQVYEGSVIVTINNQMHQLAAGEGLSWINKKLLKTAVSGTQPSWQANKSNFKSVPLQFILDELQRQYDIMVDAEAIDKNVIFTGSFTHEDLNTALKAITIPLDLSFTVENKLVRLVKNN